MPKPALVCFIFHEVFVVNSFVEYYDKTGNRQALAWWIHDNVSREFLRSIKT